MTGVGHFLLGFIGFLSFVAALHIAVHLLWTRGGDQ